MPEVPPLPDPGGDELERLVPSRASRAIYRLLYENRDLPLTMLEIRDALQAELGPQEHLGRRRRTLNQHFVIEKVTGGADTRYRLAARRPGLTGEDAAVSERMRAAVLQYGRCAMCGRTVAEHEVVLQVDHKTPQAWGGSSALENLQALCEECNRGKKDYFRSLDEYGPRIGAASQHDEPHRRIGELLKAFHPDEVRGDVLEMVAHQHQYQEDWQKRLRELRELGWDYKVRKEKDGSGRVRSFYRLVKWTPWPDGSIRGEISRRERQKRRA